MNRFDVVGFGAFNVDKLQSKSDCRRRLTLEANGLA